MCLGDEKLNGGHNTPSFRNESTELPGASVPVGSTHLFEFVISTSLCCIGNSNTQTHIFLLCSRYGILRGPLVQA